MAKSTIKFKDCVARFEELKSEIKRGQFAPIYLLMGEESYFIDELCNLLSSSILSPAEQAFNQLTVYGKDSEAGQIVNLCRQMPMMGSYEVIIVKEAQQLRQIEKLSHYTSKPQKSTILIICHKEKSVDKRSAFYKQCNSPGEVFEAIRPRDYEIGPWLSDHIASKGCSITPKGLAMLTDHLGTDISKISNELTKLLVSLPEGTRQITEAHIEENVGISKEFNNFELCKAVVMRDVKRALTIAEHFARNPKDNPLIPPHRKPFDLTCLAVIPPEMSPDITAGIISRYFTFSDGTSNFTRITARIQTRAITKSKPDKIPVITA